MPWRLLKSLARPAALLRLMLAAQVEAKKFTKTAFLGATDPAAVSIAPAGLIRFLHVRVTKLQSAARTVKVDMNEAREASVVMRPCAWVRYPAQERISNVSRHHVAGPTAEGRHGQV